MTTRTIPVGTEVAPTAEAELVVAADLSNDPYIPVVSLSNAPEATATPFIEDSAGVGGIPVVTVTAQHILEPEINVESSGTLTNAVATPTSAPTSRAEFLSATVFKKTASASLGISLVAGNDGAIYISKLQPDNPLANSPLRVGDKLLSVNNQSCADLNHHMAASLLRKVEGTVTVLVQNVGGDANLVETMIEKPKQDATVGISVARGIRGTLVVTKVAADGLFAHSLVNTGDKVISINNVSCNQLNPRGAVDVIGKAPRYVTFLTRTLSETGVVVAVSDAPTRMATNYDSPTSRADMVSASEVLVLALDLCRRDIVLLLLIALGNSIFVLLQDQRDRECVCKVLGIALVVFAVIIVVAVISVRDNRSSCDPTVSYCFDCNTVDVCEFGGYSGGQCCYQWVDTCDNDCNQLRSDSLLSSYGV